MQNEIESERPSSSLQEGLNAITQALRAAAELGINPTSLIKEICAKSGLSPEKGQFTQEIITKAEELRREAINK